MAPKKTVSVVMGDKVEKKHVVRYNCEDEGAALASAYIDKAALKKLGNPDKVKITIEAA